MGHSSPDEWVTYWLPSWSGPPVAGAAARIRPTHLENYVGTECANSVHVIRLHIRTFNIIFHMWGSNPPTYPLRPDYYATLKMLIDVDEGTARRARDPGESGGD